MKKISFFMACSFFLITACSENEEATTDPVEEDVELAEENELEEETEETAALPENLDRFSGDDPAEWMRAEPGTYGGDAYDETTVAEELQQFDIESMTDEEIFYLLLDLTAEDYREYQEYFDELEIIIDGPSERPGELDADTEGQGESGPGTDQVNVQVLFDASGSMAGEVDGQVKMDLAKEAVSDFLVEMPEETHVSLRVYGHEGNNQRDGKEESCAGTEEVYPLSPYNKNEFEDALSQFEPTGYTPIAVSMEAAQEDLADEDGENVENILYIVSDGEETCGGDPVQAAEDLHDSEIEAIVNIIGFDVSNEEQEALMEIAQAGAGEYFPADTAEQLQEVFREERNALISEWREWQNENVSQSQEQQKDYINESNEKQSEMLELTHTEQERLIDFSEESAEALGINEISLRSNIRSRAIDLRQHIRSTSIDFRQEARRQGIDGRQEMRREGLEERQELRQQN